MFRNRPNDKGPKTLGLGKMSSTYRSIVLRTIARTPGLHAKIDNIADLLNYSIWVKDNFLWKGKLRHCREEVWGDIAQLLSTRNQKLIVTEFGVAWGYVAWHWLNRYSHLIETWHGFDSFMGLPQPWRRLKAGTFSTNGVPPNFRDNRVVWHVGEIQSTSAEIQVPKVRSHQYAMLVFFDFDLFESSLIAWNAIEKFLTKGDILYFDEAYDADERQLIINHVLPKGQFRVIASSWESLAIEVLEI